jgi:phosphatidate cytidylyltransferase
VTRVLSGIVLIALTVAVVWFAPPVVFGAVAFVLLFTATAELVSLARASGLNIPMWPAATGALITLAALALPAAENRGQEAPLQVVLLAQLVAVAGVTLNRWSGGRDAIASVSASLFPSLYLALPISALLAIREHEGPAALFLLMLTVMASDTAQYYTGRLAGRRLLAPAISPKKTMEGAIGGFVFGAMALAIAGVWWLPSVPVVFRTLLGVTVVALGITGDLFESMLKRSAGVKDSSSLIPGHGGLLDRIDALLFAAPVYYIVLQYI